MSASPDPDAFARIRLALRDGRQLSYCDLQRMTWLPWRRIYPAVCAAMDAGLIGQRGRGAAWGLVWLGATDEAAP